MTENFGLEAREILDASTEGIAKLDRDWTVRYVNRAGLELLGPELDPIGRNHWEVFPGTIYEGSPFLSNYHRTMATGEPTHFSTFYGEPLHLWIEVRVSPADNGIILFFRDVTEFREQQEEKAALDQRLEVSRSRLQVAQRMGRMASWEWDLGRNTLRWDEASAWVYGRPAAEMTGYEQIFSYIHPDDRAGVEQALQPAVRGVADYQAEFRVIWPDGTVHWIEGWGRSLAAPDGKPACIVGINVDITERRLADAALMQSEKLAAVGRMASSIAHEINNPLEAVTNLLYLARTSERVEEMRAFLADADGELRRVSAITSQTLRFHRQQTRPSSVTFRHLITGIFTGQHSRLANAGVVVEERDRSVHPVLCFEGEIRQVLVNLISNAIDAMHGIGGVLYLRARNGHDWRSGRRGLLITISDTGVGLSAEARGRLFDAFYTTKGAAGNGLGLWISQDIAGRHEGRILFRSRRSPGGSGSVFTLFLPSIAAER